MSSITLLCITGKVSVQVRSHLEEYSIKTTQTMLKMIATLTFEGL